MAFAQTVTDNGKTYKESVLSLDYRKTHGILVNDAVDPQQAPAYRQLTSGLAAEAAARSSAIATVEAARAALEAALTDQLNAETQNRIAGDQQLESRLQQVIEGLTYRTVAARYEGTTAPAVADVPGVDTAAAADDWHSWILWDQGAGNPNTGIYTLSGGTLARVSSVTMQAGLLTFVNGGTFADTQWLMIDDPVDGVADFVPWQRVSEFSTTGPLYKEANVVRLAWDANYLSTQVNGTTGETELTINQAFRDRVTTLETNVTALQGDVATLQTDVDTLQGDVVALQGEVDALQLADENFTTQINGLLATDVAQGNRLTTLETSQAAQDTAISGLQAADTAFDTRLGTTEGNVTALQTSDASQTARLTNLENTKVDQAAVDTSITAYDRANKIIRPFTVTSTVQQGSIYVHTLDCATGLGTTDFVMAEARFTADTPLRRLDTPPQYIAPDTCRILVEGTDATIAAGAVEGFFERFYRA
jgi:uncharacterized coiled-coil protein SlyX